MLFLMRSEILGLLFNTLTANFEYSRSNRENLPSPIQIIYKTIDFFRYFGWNFWYVHEISNVLKKTMSLIDQVILKLFTPKYVLI